MAVASPSGFAVRRNGSCLDIETDCGPTVKPFRICCPALAYCPSQYNVDCCPSPANCTESLLETPSCANKTWTLYDNHGYFCCEPGTIGYNATNSFSDGCASPGFPPKDAQLLQAISLGQTIAPSSTSSSSQLTTTTTASTTPATSSAPVMKSDDHKTPVGAIVGGVIGGLAVIALFSLLYWMFYRRHKRHATPTTPAAHDPAMPYRQDESQKYLGVHELPGYVRHELPPDSVPKPPVELPGTTSLEMNGDDRNFRRSTD